MGDHIVLQIDEPQKLPVLFLHPSEQGAVVAVDGRLTGQQFQHLHLKACIGDTLAGFAQIENSGDTIVMEKGDRYSSVLPVAFAVLLLFGCRTAQQLNHSAFLGNLHLLLGNLPENRRNRPASLYMIHCAMISPQDLPDTGHTAFEHQRFIHYSGDTPVEGEDMPEDIIPLPELLHGQIRNLAGSVKKAVALLPFSAHQFLEGFMGADGIRRLLFLHIAEMKKPLLCPDSFFSVQLLLPGQNGKILLSLYGFVRLNPFFVDELLKGLLSANGRIRVNQFLPGPIHPVCRERQLWIPDGLSVRPFCQAASADSSPVRNQPVRHSAFPPMYFLKSFSLPSFPSGSNYPLSLSQFPHSKQVLQIRSRIQTSSRISTNLSSPCGVIFVSLSE